MRLINADEMLYINTISGRGYRRDIFENGSRVMVSWYDGDGPFDDIVGRATYYADDRRAKFEVRGSD